MSSEAAGAQPPARFAALRNKDSRPYLFAAGLSMMGDNNEHVITYWALWQKFHSPALVGFEVISHWLPFLLLSVFFGALAEQHDCRKLIQGAQGLFIAVQICWGVLFLTGTLQVWEACVLLVLHGMAGSLWGPAEQLMLHDFVEKRDLPSAVRMNATFRSLGQVFGPVVGSVLLIGLGPAMGVLVNAVFFVPMTILMFRTRFTGHVRAGGVPPRERVTMRDSLRVLQSLRSNHLLVGMIVLSGLTAITIGGALQVSMPVIADGLGAGQAGILYSGLLLANGIGGVGGGFLLEATGILRPSLRTAAISTVAFGVLTAVFALTHNYVIVLVALLLGGLANIASMSIMQSVVQLEAPTGQRGRIFGVYGMFSSGLRVGNGITLGVLGAVIGIPYAIAICAAALVVGTVVTALYARRGRIAG